MPIPLRSLACVLALGTALQAQAPTSPAPPSAPIPQHAKGSFEPKLLPLPNDGTLDPTMGRFSLDKAFHGDLEALGHGQMLTVGTAEKGSAAYVAVERVEGTLRGRKGTFALQHSGTLNRGVPTLVVSVVPDSGTGDLAGIAGTFSLILTGGKHDYDFTYTLPVADPPR